MMKFQGECLSDFLDHLGHLQLFASVVDNVIKAISGIILEVCFISASGNLQCLCCLAFLYHIFYLNTHFAFCDYSEFNAAVIVVVMVR